MSKLFSKPVLSEEVIDFQLSDSFVADLSSIYDKLLVDINDFKNERKSFFKLGKDKPYKEQINKLVYDRFGLPVSLTWSLFTPTAAGIFPPSNLNKNILRKHDLVMFPKKVREVAKDLDKELNKNKVKINLKKATIKGLPVKNKIIWYMDFFVLTSSPFNMTVKELVAVSLHEIGHAFTHIENMDKMVKTNFPLLDLVNQKISGKEPEDIDYIVRNAMPTDKGKTDYVTLKDSSSKVIWTTNTYKLFVDSFQELNETGRYSDTSSEQLADQFSVRFGLAKDLSTALDKINVFNQTDSWVMVANIVFSMYIGFFLSVISGTLFLLPVFLLLGIYNGLNNSSDSGKDMTYDNAKDRINRVRQQYIAMLADPSIPSKVKDVYIEDIDTIDKVLKNTKSEESWITTLANAVTGGGKVRRRKDLEQALENLAYNDLYVKKHQLSQYV